MLGPGEEVVESNRARSRLVRRHRSEKGSQGAFELHVCDESVRSAGTTHDRVAHTI